MVAEQHRIGWIGLGRMGYPMTERLLKAGHEVTVWNRTRAKAEPLAVKGAHIADRPGDLAGIDILFTMVSTGEDLKQVLFGDNGVAAGGRVPGIVVDCSSISVEESAECRARLTEAGAAFIAAPVSGNGKCARQAKCSRIRA
jgi:3-hydroxyisobutyrate dehydrogenase